MSAYFYPNPATLPSTSFHAPTLPSLFDKSRSWTSDPLTSHDDYHLPPIHTITSSPSTSPSPPFLDFSSSSSSSSGSPRSCTFPSPEQTGWAYPRSWSPPAPSNRKGSIASLLNSDPEVKQLDGENQRTSYPPHFSHTLKRGRPRQKGHDHHPPSLFLPTPQYPTYFHPQQPTSPPQQQQQQQPKEQQQQQRQVVQPRKDDQQPSKKRKYAGSGQQKMLVEPTTKGLRHFSKQLCDKVAQHGVTTYNRVADELAMDIRNNMNVAGPKSDPMKKSSHGTSTHAYDQKNIRRRVYDALNVLMAMGIIAKDKKEIKWLGVPACYQGDQAHNKNKNADLLQQIEQEERRQAELESMVDRTRMQIRGKLTRHLQVCDLIHRNQQQPTTDDSVIFLPFFAVESDQNTLIDKTQDGKSAIVSIEADVERAIYEDTDVLHHLSFGKSITPELATCLPDPAWQQFLTDRTSVNVA